MAAQYRHVSYLIELQEKSSEDFLKEHVSSIFLNHQPALSIEIFLSAFQFGSYSYLEGSFACFSGCAYCVMQHWGML